jgi:hypothetical protein
VTFKDLQKVIQSQSGPEQSQLLQRLRDKPFWIWDPKQHKQEDIKTKGDCCFNHIIGLPRKDGIEKSIFDYERLLFDSLLIPDFYNPSKHNFWNKRMKKMVEYKIMEPVAGEKGNFHYAGEFIDHCNSFRRETPLTKYEVGYIESHGEEIKKDYAQLAISEYLPAWLNDDTLYDKFWNDIATDPMCEQVGSSRLMREDEELEQERGR